jgi:hypothetical protein
MFYSLDLLLFGEEISANMFSHLQHTSTRKQIIYRYSILYIILYGFLSSVILFQATRILGSTEAGISVNLGHPQGRALKSTLNFLGRIPCLIKIRMRSTVYASDDAAKKLPTYFLNLIRSLMSPVATFLHY